MDADDVRSLGRVLMYGGAETRRALARRLAADDQRDLWRLLVGTVRSEGPWLLRARCLEVLGHVVANADAERAGLILSELLAPPSDRAGGPRGTLLHGSVSFS
jgi:hypothetical protein